jgi:hypothetical protein
VLCLIIIYTKVIKKKGLQVREQMDWYSRAHDLKKKWIALALFFLYLCAYFFPLIFSLLFFSLNESDLRKNDAYK